MNYFETLSDIRAAHRALFLLASLACSSVIGCAARDMAGDSAAMGAASAQVASAAAGNVQLGAGLKNIEFLEQFAATKRFSLGEPASISPLPDGSGVLFLRAASSRSFVQDLWLFDVATRSERVLLTAELLLGGATEQLSAAELARRERQRMSSRGISGFLVSDDGKSLAVPLSGVVYVMDLAKLRAASRDSGIASAIADAMVQKIESSKGPAIDPQFSPNNKLLAVVREGALYVADVATGGETAVSPAAEGAVSFGEAEFVAQEEMDRSHGTWWGPNSDSIVYQRTDTTGLPMFHIPDPADPAKEPTVWPYPRAGGLNAKVTLWIAPVGGKAERADAAKANGAAKHIEVLWDHEAYPYLTRVYWPKNAPLMVQVMNRTQTEQLLLRVDSATGKTTQMLRETDPAWINLPKDGFAWMKDGSGFVWLTQQVADTGGDEKPAGSAGTPTADRGWAVEFHNADGSFNRLIAPRSAGVMELASVDEKLGVVYLHTAPIAYQTRIEGWALTGSTSGAMQWLGELRDPESSAAAAPSMHSGSFAEKAPVIARTVSSLDGDAPTRWMIETISLRPASPEAAAAGRLATSLIGELSSKAETSPIIPRPELFSLGLPGVANGDDERDRVFAMVVKPKDFDPAKRYPVINFVYAGPTSNTVSANARAYLINQWYANQGFIVVSIDNRGTPRRGRAWERAIAGNLIDLPLADQADAMLALCAQIPQMDRMRMGVFGWSFGGYFSAMATMRRPDVFAAGVAGAPVCDWQDYDTFYTERYLGLPEQNAEGYKASSVLTWAKDLRVPLLIIHGTADDNVYSVNSLRMTDGLFAAGKHFEFLPLASQTHMVTMPAIVRQMHTRIAEFFRLKLAAK